MRVRILSSVANFTVDATENELDSTAHDVREGDTIRLSTTGTLPAPVDADAADTLYYAINIETNSFQITYTKPSEAISNSGVTADATLDSLTFANHGFVEDDRISFTTTAADLPAGLSAGVHYYAVNVSQNTFQVSTTLGGSAVDITDTGTGTHTAHTGQPVDFTGTGAGTHSYESGVAENTSETPEVRKYVLTYVAKYGDIEQEGAPSLPSIDSVTWRTGQRVVLTGMPTGPGTGNFNLTKKRIYRVNTSNTAAEYQEVAEVDIGQTEFIDDLLGVDLGIVLETEDYDMPPHDMQGLRMMSNGMAVAHRGKDIMLMEPFKVHAWPIVYRLRVPETIVSVGVFGVMALQPFSFAMITTDGKPYTLRGSHPSSMTMDDIELDYPNVSSRSTVDMGKHGTMYASSDGMVVASGQSIDLTTQVGNGVWAITPKQWRAKKPSTIVANRWEQYYIGFYDDGATTEGFLFDPETKDFIFLDDYATAVHLNPNTGVLHIFSGTKIQSWDTGSALTATWKDKKRFSTAKVSYTAARVEATAYADTTLVVDADQSEVVNQAVSSRAPFRINTGQLANIFELELQTADTVRSAEMATSIQELLGE